MNVTQTHGVVYDAAEVARLFGSKKCWERLIFVPPPASLPGFITFFDAGFSINLLRDVVANKETIFLPQRWYANEPFATFAEPPGYRQLRMTALDALFGKTFAEQQALLSPDEEVPSARAVVMGMVIHFLATGECLFQDHLVRCLDVDSDGLRACVGHFDRDGLIVHYHWVDHRDSDIGLASSRKF